MAVGDDYPIPPPPRCNLQEGRKRLREPSSDSLTESHPCVHPSTPRNSLIAPKASEVPRGGPPTKESISTHPSTSLGPGGAMNPRRDYDQGGSRGPTSPYPASVRKRQRESYAGVCTRPPRSGPTIPSFYRSPDGGFPSV